jgi:hypothetical protein
MSPNRSRIFAIAVLMASVFAAPSLILAQVLTTAIGGIEVNPEGVLDAPTEKSTQTAAELMRQRLQRVPDDLAGQTEFRMVSLRGLEMQIRAAAESGGELPDEVRYMAGLQRIQYVFVDPENNDILLAGPAEGWTVDRRGNVVGNTTGQPVVMLDDLLVALRSVNQARTVGITCSIDPTPEGRRALNAFLKKQKQFRPGVTKGVEQALGAQHITITGVPADSHFARVLVAADFRMKRFAMMLEPAPVDEMPSFLELVKSSRRGLNNMMPRWWIACDYEPVRQTEDGLAWEIRGRGVKVMTEDEIIGAEGTVRGSGKTNPIAQQWADSMTEKYTAISRADTVFGQLRNVMDISLAAAIIERNDLRGVAGCQLETLYGDNSLAAIELWPTPTTVATQSSFIKVGRQYVITASGGVQIDSWKWASRTAIAADLADARTKATRAPDASWTW